MSRQPCVGGIFVFIGRQLTMWGRLRCDARALEMAAALAQERKACLSAIVIACHSVITCHSAVFHLRRWRRSHPSARTFSFRPVPSPLRAFLRESRTISLNLLAAHQHRGETAFTTAARMASAIIVTESLFSMDGDIAPLAELADLANRHGAHLIVDEAHATGCFGSHGSGLVDEAGLRPQVLATMHTGGKALGVMGAYVCGSELLRQLLINCCRHFIFTTALPPLIAASWLDALLYTSADDAGRRRLHDNARLYRAQLKRHGIDSQGEHYIVPVVLGDDTRATRAAERLQNQGFDIRAIRPPTVPEGACRLRISIHADHDTDVLTRAAAAVAEAAS